MMVAFCATATLLAWITCWEVVHDRSHKLPFWGACFALILLFVLAATSCTPSYNDSLPVDDGFATVFYGGATIAILAALLLRLVWRRR